MKRAVCFAFAFAFSFRSLAGEPPTLRLPAGIAPVRYAVDLRLDPEQDSFSGSIQIDVVSERETDTVWLNATDLTFTSVSARLAGDAVPAKAEPIGKDFVRLTLSKKIPVGPFRIDISYSGRVSLRDTTGVFRQKDGDSWYIFSKFEPIHARRAFPCFDEPSLKAPWQLTLHVKKGLLAVSNTPVLSETDEDGGMKKVVFVPTKPLPTYLVGFGAGPFEIVSGGTAGRNHVPVRIIVPKGRTPEARWAAASTGPLLDLLEAYFDVPFPWEKLDHLVIPQRGTFGAMENPGLVIYVSPSILSRPEDETPRFLRSYASVCAHETAHMWFGDLVTMAWWDDLWLNEAFATWMGTKIVDRWKPEWGWRAEGVAARSRTMDADGLVSARSIRQPIQSNDDILNAFDGITYQKGAAVLDMFESWLGEEPFRKGVQTYLRAHPFGSATSSDFLASIASATKNGAVPASFSTFLDQPGVPIVTAELSCKGGASRLLLLQKRFVPTGSPGAAAEKWQIPICVRVGESPAPRVCSLLATERGAFPLPGPACPEIAVANAGASGYYRVQYKGGQFEKIAASGGRSLTPPERVALLLGVGALARADEVPMARALELAAAFAGDPERHVVEAAVSLATMPRDLFVTADLLPGYRGFVADVFGPRARALGFRAKRGEDDDTKLLRVSVVEFVARETDDAALAAEARSEALAWLKNRRAVEPEMVEPVLSIAARHGDAVLFTAFLAEARATKDRRDRARLLTALGAFREPAVESAKLAITLSPEFDGRESFVVLRESFRDRATREGAWAFLKANFDALAARLPREAPAAFPDLAAGFSDETHRADVEAFFKDRSPKFTGGPRRLAQALEEIRLRTAFREAQQASVAEFLAGHQGRSTVDVTPR